MQDFECKFCKKLLKNKNSLTQHEIRCKLNPQRKAYNNFSDYIVKNRKGKTSKNSEEIRRQCATMPQKYAEGYVSPLKGKSRVFNYVYQEHNDTEICKWMTYINSHLPKSFTYSLIPSVISGYNVVSKLSITSPEIKNLIKEKDIILEQELIMVAIINQNTPLHFTIHHINKNRKDNH